MAPDDRRAALVDATIPLLRSHGVALSTRQIAEAAGVAEGTIFRVFPDKSSLIRAAVLSAFDAEPTVLALHDVDTSLPLRPKLKAMAQVLCDRVTDIHTLMGLLRGLPGLSDPREFREQIMSAAAAVREAVAWQLRGDTALLRCEPTVAAHMLGSLITNTRRPFFLPGEPELSSDTIVDLLLDGLLAPQANEDDTPTRDGESARC